MSRLLVEHAPHLAFIAIGVVAFFWTARKNPVSRPPATALAPAHPASRPVRRAVARRGLLALGPLLGAVGTGASLYAIGIGDGSAPNTVIWAHTGVSLLALVLVAYKLRGFDRGSLRLDVLRARLPQLGSAVLATVSIPVLLTGVSLLIAPSASSFAAYAHLVSSVWWTGLLVWHLRRHVGASLRALAMS